MTYHRRMDRGKRIVEYLAAGKAREAEDLWMEAAMEEAASAEFLLALADAFVSAGHGETAAFLLGMKGSEWVEEGEAEKALPLFRKAVFLSPESGEPREGVLRCLRILHEDVPHLEDAIRESGLLAGNTPPEKAFEEIGFLLSFRPGSFWLHPSFGVGRLASFRLERAKALFDFDGNTREMGLRFARKSMTPLPPSHVLSRRATDPEGLREMASVDPLGLLVLILESFDGEVLADRIKEILKGRVIPEKEWPRAWDRMRSAGQASGKIRFPALRSQPIRLRKGDKDAHGEAAETLRRLRRPQEIVSYARDYLKEVGRKGIPEAQRDILKRKLELAASEGLEKKDGLALEAAFLLEDAGLASGYTTTGVLSEWGDLPALLGNLSIQALRRSLRSIPEAFPKNWADVVLGFWDRLPQKAAGEAAAFLTSHGFGERVHARLEKNFRTALPSPSLLLWAAERIEGGEAGETRWVGHFLPALLKTLDAIPPHKGTRIRKLLAREDLLLHVSQALDPKEAKGLATRVEGSSLLNDIEKREILSALAGVHEGIELREEKGEETILTSTGSYEERQRQYEEIVQKKIPQNSREIGHAREYGDLSENFEYQAAKDLQALLFKRAHEIRDMLASVRPSNFDDVRGDEVEPGTRLRLREAAGDGEREVTVLGAWDGDPDRGIIAYTSAQGKRLMGKRPGEKAALDLGGGEKSYVIEEIRPLRSKGEE